MRPLPLLAALALPVPQDGAGLEVPAGFEAELIAEAPELRWPSAVLALDDGSLLVAEDPMDMIGPADQPIDRILRLVFEEDGQHRTEVFAEGLYAIFGLEQVDDSVLVVNMPHLTRLADTDGDGRADEREVLVEGLGPQPPGAPGGCNDHAVSGVRLAMDGFLYVSVGDKGIPRAVGTDGSEITLRGGGVVRVLPDGSRLEVVATGTRNHLDVAIDERGECFTFDNSDDGLGWWTRATHVIDGGHYGYPFEYQAHPERMLPCMTDYGAGAPTGGLAYREAAWPLEFRGNLFWCEWGEQALRRLELEPDGATFRVFRAGDFVTAGDVPNFRPTDLCESPDGRFLYVTDWAHPGWKDDEVTGRLWRIRRAEDDEGVTSRARELPDDPGALVDALGDASFRHRLRAQRALIRSKDPRVVEYLVRTLRENPNELKRRHAVWALVGIGTAPARLAVVEALGHPTSDDTRTQVVRAYGLYGRKPHAELLRLLTRDEPRVRREAANALGRLGGVEEAARLATALQLEEDPFVRWSIRSALRRIGAWEPAVVNWVSLSSDRGRDLLESMRGAYDLAAARRLAFFVAGQEDGLPDGWVERLAEERARALEVLADMHRRPEPWDGTWWSTQPAKQSPPPKVVVWEGSRLVTLVVRGALQDGAAPVRRAAVEAVRSMPDPSSLPELRALFEREEDAGNRRLILEVLADLGDEDATPLLEAVVADPGSDEALRLVAFEAASAIGTAPMLELLRAAARDAELPPATLARCLEALGEAGDEASWSVLEHRCAHGDPAVRAAAARALARVRGAAAIPRLAALLDDDEPDVRLAVLAALGDLESVEAVPALLPRVADEVYGGVALRALARTPDARALDAYLGGLFEPSTREACRAALHQVRGEVRGVLEERFLRGELDSREVEEVRAILSGPRPILDWSVLGPFARGSVEPRFEGAQALFDGSNAPRSHRAEPIAGHVDLARLLSHEPLLDAFAWTEIALEEPREVELVVGSDDTIALWLDGVLVHDFGGHRTWGPDQDRVALHLESGAHTLLVRVGQTDSGWGFSVALSGEETGPLFKESEASPPPPAVEEYRAYAQANVGDSARGFLLFRDERRLACTRCHSIASARGRLGDSVGPDLDGIGGRHDRAELITSLLEPSRRVADGYRASSIWTLDGELIFGQIAREDSRRLVVVDPSGEPREMPVAEVAERRQSDLSVMPEELQTLISKEEFSDLLAFLESLGGGGGEPDEKPARERGRDR